MSFAEAKDITSDALRREYERIARVQQELAAVVGHEEASQLYAQTLGHIFASARKERWQAPRAPPITVAPLRLAFSQGPTAPSQQVASSQKPTASLQQVKTNDAALAQQKPLVVKPLVVTAAPYQKEPSDLDMDRGLLQQRPAPRLLSTELQQIGRWRVRVHVSQKEVQATDRLFMRFVAGVCVCVGFFFYGFASTIFSTYTDGRYSKEIAALCPSLDVLLSPCSYATTGAMFMLKPPGTMWLWFVNAFFLIACDGPAISESKEDKTSGQGTLPLRIFEGMKTSLRTVVQRHSSPHSVLFLAWAWLTTVRGSCGPPFDPPWRLMRLLWLHCRSTAGCTFCICMRRHLMRRRRVRVNTSSIAKRVPLNTLSGARAASSCWSRSCDILTVSRFGSR